MILFDRVSYRYNEKSETSFVVKEVSFSCRKGLINGIVGANGSGKSTILKLIAGLIHPMAGQITVDGVEPCKHKIDKGFLAGIIFQNTDNQIVGTTVEEDLAFGLENMGVPPEEMHLRVNETASRFNIQHLLNTPVHHLSGGQKQLLCIASVMVMEPAWIVFDEPTCHLDPWAREDFWNILHSISTAKDVGVVVVSQLPEDLQQFDHLIALKSGVLGFTGSISQFREQKNSSEFVSFPESWKYESLTRNQHV